jgi:hypothetical protein
MRVAALRRDPLDAPPSVAPYAVPGQVFLTPGREYAVHAIAVYQGLVLFQLTDDTWQESRLPAWYPSWLFSLTDAAVAEDWVVGVFEAEPALVIGPEFVASDLESYEQMVQLHRSALERFRTRAVANDP